MFNVYSTNISLVRISIRLNESRELRIVRRTMYRISIELRVHEKNLTLGKQSTDLESNRTNRFSRRIRDIRRNRGLHLTGGHLSRRSSNATIRSISPYDRFRSRTRTSVSSTFQRGAARRRRYESSQRRIDNDRSLFRRICNESIKTFSELDSV